MARAHRYKYRTLKPGGGYTYVYEDGGRTDKPRGGAAEVAAVERERSQAKVPEGIFGYQKSDVTVTCLDLIRGAGGMVARFPRQVGSFRYSEEATAPQPGFQGGIANNLARQQDAAADSKAEDGK